MWRRLNQDEAFERKWNMKGVFSTVAMFTAVILFCATAAAAQEKHTHMHDSSEQLGTVNFTVSCNPQAQKQFNRAVAWLHSFEYEEAEKAFTEIIDVDPRCGMAYWGIAMSNFHPLWAPPGPAELKKGESAIQKAKEVGAPTPREQAYIEAIGIFYKDYDKLDHRTRTFAYSDAMKQLCERNSSDSEAAVFYALTLIATGMMSQDKTYVREKEAAQILNRVLTREPQHPGVAHYLIHSYDYPALAELALPAARAYAKIAPSSAHAQHMPSHIFTRLGLWDEDIKSNLQAKSSAEAHAVRNHLRGPWDEQLHAMDYLVYAYLQRAQDKHAAGVLDELYNIQRVEPESFKVAYAFTAIPARYALERRQWKEAATLPAPSEHLKTFPWERFQWALAHIHFARAVGAARSGDTAAASVEVEKLKAIQQKLVEVKGDYDWARQVDIERMVASGWLAQAEGKHDEALALLRKAADLDDATEKHPVTPGAILPAREELGELLLELKQPQAALMEFETSFRTTPNRLNGIYGAARAARLAGDQKRAKSYYEKLLAQTSNTDSVRPEINEAKTFLTNASAAKPRNLYVDVRYDKNKDITTLSLRNRSLWRDPLGREWLAISLSFSYPKTTILKPKELILTFDVASKDWEPFPVDTVSAVADGSRIDLGEVNERVQPISKDSPFLYERRSLKISFENFSQMALAKKLTLVVGDRKYEVSERDREVLRDFLELMQREGEKVD